MKRLGLVCAVGLLAAAGQASAADLFRPGAWSALAADRTAVTVGDTLTVIIDESSTATDSIQNGTSKGSHLGGQVSAGTFNKSAALDLSNSFQGTGQTGRAHKMAAQISVVVDAVLPNGDLHVSGAQNLKVNGEHTSIVLKGRVRRVDIASDNSVLSTRLADATIDYDGAGFVGNGARPGILSRLLGWLP